MKTTSKIITIVALTAFNLSMLHCRAVELVNHKNVEQAAVDKVAHAIKELKKDPAFENTANNHEIPPLILTEGLHHIGQTCKNGCEISLEEFKKHVHENFYVYRTYATIARNAERTVTVDEQKRSVTDDKIAHLYYKLEEFGIIRNNTISSDDGAVIDASIRSGLDQHLYGTLSRGFEYRNPVKGSIKKSLK
ncbi:MAG: hypothetical protein WC707_00205 [Candidatus Babeliaceae bacterium]|jgi:hypothetical protein